MLAIFAATMARWLLGPNRGAAPYWIILPVKRSRPCQNSQSGLGQLLMRAAHDAVGNDDREGALVLDELKYRSDDGRIRASPVSTFQSCISLGSACSAGTMPTATFEARLRSGP
jgi:hypothetical protein